MAEQKDELEAILADEKPTQPPASEETQEEKNKKAEEERVKAEQDRKLAEETRAEALKILKDAQRMKKAAERLTGKTEEEEIPKIDMTDPSAQAWDRHIEAKASPLRQELEREKDENRQIALDDWLADKPALARDPEKLKKVMTTYRALADTDGITERNLPMIQRYFDKAYRAEYGEELSAARRSERIRKAQEEAGYSDIAVSSGATSYPKKEDFSIPDFDEQSKARIIQIYGSIEQYMKEKKKYG